MSKIRTKPTIQHVGAWVRQLHRNERGVLTITSVFALFVFTILLMMIVNVATHLDDKIKRQNAADAATYSGGVMLARGMNTLAYSNHLLTDVFAVTAFLREGRDRHAEQLAPEILDEWERAGERFRASDFEKFRALGEAIVDKSARQPAGKDRRLLSAFGNLTAAAADFALPVFEYVLQGDSTGFSAGASPAANPEGGLIPQFQRLVIGTIPELSQRVTSEIAWRHGLTNRDLQNLPGSPRSDQNGRSEQLGLLWRTNVEAVGLTTDESNPLERTLPVVDPSPLAPDFGSLPNGSAYLELARLQRRELAKHYLELWTRDKLSLFDSKAQMSRFSELWRIFTCAELGQLLEAEYPDVNLPFMIRRTDLNADWDQLRAEGTQAEINRNLERDFQFVGVVYREHRRETGPGLFKNPLARQADAVTFAQVSLFLPRGRRYLSTGGGGGEVGLGGTFGFTSGLTSPPTPATGPVRPEDERWPRENWPGHWDLLNQNWTVKLVPATVAAIPDILQTSPPGPFNPRLPNLGGSDIERLNRVNTH